MDLGRHDLDSAVAHGKPASSLLRLDGLRPSDLPARLVRRRHEQHRDSWRYLDLGRRHLDPAIARGKPPGPLWSLDAHHPATSQLVLFGGIGLDGLPFRDTWTWNGTTWTQQSPVASPPARYQASLAYDAATSQLVLFGGVGGPSGMAGRYLDLGRRYLDPAVARASPPARYNAWIGL